MSQAQHWGQEHSQDSRGKALTILESVISIQLPTLGSVSKSPAGGRRFKKKKKTADLGPSPHKLNGRPWGRCPARVIAGDCHGSPGAPSTQPRLRAPLRRDADESTGSGQGSLVGLLSEVCG